MSDRTGTVYLVGSGPGAIADLTVHAYTLLTQADVVVYDALVDTQLLQLVPPECLTVDVGKRGGKPSMPQAEINRVLVAYCQQGKQVVRLKSGDPFIFGRSTSEIQALLAAQCHFEVVPGISSALAAPLLAGIPLTDPVLSKCFVVFSAHEPDTLNWPSLAQIETLVILMGGRSLETIVSRLQRHGRSLQTPVAVIRWAGHPQQEIWIGTLTDILIKTAGVSLSPCVIIIGKVVELRDYLQPPFPRTSHALDLPPQISSGFISTPFFDNRPVTSHLSSPLSGKTILITRAAGQSSQFSDRLQQAGASVIEMPALEIAPPSSWHDLDQAIADLQSFHWLILTSTNGVDYFFERLLQQKQDARNLTNVRIAVVGEKTAASLKQHGLNPDFVPPNFVADSLVDHFPEPLANIRVLFPRVESGGRDVLVKEFTAKGAIVTEVAAYQSCCPMAIAPAALQALQAHAVDVITFASSKTVQCFCQLVNAHALPDNWLEHVCIASIGPQTSNACRKLLGRVDVEAKEYTLDGLTTAIVDWADS